MEWWLEEAFLDLKAAMTATPVLDLLDFTHFMVVRNRNQNLVDAR